MYFRTVMYVHLSLGVRSNQMYVQFSCKYLYVVYVLWKKGLGSWNVEWARKCDYFTSYLFAPMRLVIDSIHIISFYFILFYFICSVSHTFYFYLFLNLFLFLFFFNFLGSVLLTWIFSFWIFFSSLLFSSLFSTLKSDLKKRKWNEIMMMKHKFKLKIKLI